MWRELRLLAAKKPLIASMADVAASGGYYMAMAASTIVAEELTLTGSIGVVTGLCMPLPIGSTNQIQFDFNYSLDRVIIFFDRKI